VYTAYVSDVSYYSGKLEAFLRYKEIPHRRVEIETHLLREVILPATGYMKVPVMQCPDGRWLKDSTPMLQWLDREHPRATIYPEDPAQRFLALLVEDYADEWLWRPAMYYRWNFADSHQLLRHRLGRELSRNTRYPAALLGWYMRWRQYWVYVRGDGVRAHNEAEVQALYARTLAQLTGLLQDKSFLLGDSPSIVDFAFFASMFRHFALDPHSARQMIDTAPAVYAWVARLWDARASREGASATANSFSRFDGPEWDAVFEEIGRDYLPYLDANAEAYAREQRRFDLQLGATHYPRLPVVRYRVGWSPAASPAGCVIQSRLLPGSMRSSCCRWISAIRLHAVGMASACSAVPLGTCPSHRSHERAHTQRRATGGLQRPLRAETGGAVLPVSLRRHGGCRHRGGTRPHRAAAQWPVAMAGARGASPDRAAFPGAILLPPPFP
jgi:glutathione S-transferase